MTPERNRAQKLRSQYGISLDEYAAQLAKQEGKCALCGSTEAKGRWGVFNVDHCHETGALRGLLCNDCNTGLGKLGDTVESLARATAYLANGGVW